jgi:hypothetical protein
MGSFCCHQLHRSETMRELLERLEYAGRLVRKYFSKGRLMRKGRMLGIPAFAAFLVGVFVFGTKPVSGDDWQPISQEELRMTELAEAPGAPAVYLYRQVDRSDKLRGSREFNYVRIKVFTEEGRRYGNVDIPLVGGKQSISSIRARTIHPDGTIVNFDGKVYEQTIEKFAGHKYLAKTFTLPDVQVGSILEYQYYRDFQDFWFYNVEWVLTDRLFTRFAKFSMDGYTEHGLTLRWNYPAGLPDGAKPPVEGANEILRMEVRNVPAFVEEDYMPPENELRQTVEFIYSFDHPDSDVDRFWRQFGKKAYGEAEGFAGKSGFLTQITNQTVAQGDAPEQKLQKIYERAQQIRNLSYGNSISLEEREHEGIKKNSTAEDVWKSGAGTKHEIDWLFLGMVRAAGMEASPVAISNRKNYFFKKARMNTHEMGYTGVMVKMGGKDILLDPGAKFAPPGLLPWEETGVPALKLDKDGGTWFQTELGSSDLSQIQRTADLKLSESGSLEGKLKVTFTGQEAFARRIEAAVQDDVARKRTLEDQVKSYIPLGSEVELIGQPDWTSSANELKAEFMVRMPAWATVSAKRMLLPAGFFVHSQKQAFEHSERHQAVYFEHPFENVDEVNIVVPEGWQVTSVPKPETVDLKAAKYDFMVMRAGKTLHVKRDLAVNFVLMEQKYYSSLRGFFQKVKSDDEQQIVLQTAVATSGN